MGQQRPSPSSSDRGVRSDREAIAGGDGGITFGWGVGGQSAA